jgi:hypothetical protein
LGLLDRRKDLNRKINIFTTNYDGCLSHTADSLLMKGSHDFVVNDGTSDFTQSIFIPKTSVRFNVKLEYLNEATMASRS